MDVTEDGKANGTFTIEKGNSDDELGGNGVLVEAFVDNDDNVTLVVINTYVGEISKVTAAKDGDDRYVTVDGRSLRLSPSRRTTWFSIPWLMVRSRP